MNNLARIHRQTDDHGGFKEEPLDYEQTWEDDKFFTFKCYDADARCTYLLIDKDVVMESILGDINQNALPPRVPLPRPPQEGK